MVSERPRRPTRRKKLGRGLSEVSHIFLSGAEKGMKGEAGGAAGSPNTSPPAIVDAMPDGFEEGFWLPDANLISITSGERIPGKTLLAANLAFGLFTEGRSVGIVNADSEKPDILDITSAVPSDDGRLATASPRFGGLPVGDAFGGLSPAAEEAAAAARVSPLAAVEAVAGRAQNVVIDTSPWADASRAVWAAADLTLVVARAGSEAMQASYVTVKRVRSMSPVGRIGLVVNMAAGRAEANKCFRKMSEVCRRFLKINIRDYGYIVQSEIAEEASRKAVPVAQAYPESALAKCVQSILKLIMMDESAIARRRREVTYKTCALREGR